MYRVLWIWYNLTLTYGIVALELRLPEVEVIPSTHDQYHVTWLNIYRLVYMLSFVSSFLSSLALDSN